MRRIIKNLIILAGALVLIGLIFYFSSYVLRLQQANQRAMYSLSSPDLNRGIQSIRNNIFPKAEIMEDVLCFLPKIKQDVELKNVLLDIANEGQYIQKGSFASDLMQGKPNALVPLEKLNVDLGYLQKYKLKFVQKWLKETHNWLLVLGEDKTRHYLVLFQDPYVPRPTGGLLGNYAMVTCSSGAISLKGGSIFSLDNIFLSKVIPPSPLQTISNKWFFHDLNWFFDFPSSGRKILDAYNQLGTGIKLDGVVLVNPDTVKDVLSISGPINVKGYDSAITVDTFDDFFQNQIQGGADLINQESSREYSRYAFASFISSLQKKLQTISSSQWQKIIPLLENDLKNKDIQLFFQDDNLEYYFDSLGATGKITESKDDYLAVVINSLQHNFQRDKRTKYATLQTEFTPSGVINTLTIRADKRSDFPSDQDDYIQLYLPPGTVVLKTKNCFWKEVSEPLPYNQLGFKQDPDIAILEKTKIRDTKHNIELLAESNKLVVSTWAKLSSRPFLIQYKVPNRQDISFWELVIQKQSGQSMVINYNVVPPAGKTIQPTLFPLGKNVSLEEDLNIQLHFTSLIND